MSDERLRDLELRRRHTGSVEDEARLLLERVRSGALPRRSLELAGVCGHPAALLALPRSGSDADRTLADLEAALVQHGGLVCARAAVAIALLSAELADLPRRNALERCEDYLACPCDDHFGRLGELANPPYPTDPRGRLAARAIRYAALLVTHQETDAGVAESLHEVVVSVVGALDLHPSAIEAALAELVSWILGRSDPLSERMEARRRDGAT